MAVRLTTENDVATAFREVAETAREELIIASGWIRGSALRLVVTPDVRRRVASEGLRIRLAVRLAEPKDLEITDVDALEGLKALAPARVGIRYSSRLHAKLVIADGRSAVITSSNLTPTAGFTWDEGAGAWTNFEAGVVIADDPAIVAEARAQFERVWAQAFEIDEDTLGIVCEMPTATAFQAAGIRPFRTGDFVVGEDVEAGVHVLGRIARVTALHPTFPRLFPGEGEGDGGGGRPPELASLGAIFASPDKVRSFLLARSVTKRALAFDLADVEVLREVSAPPAPVDPRQPLRPVAPGSRVRRPTAAEMAALLGASDDRDSVVIGTVLGHAECALAIDVPELVGKHLAVLGMTGSGKSHFAKVFLGGLAARARSTGLTVVVLDPHGEYADLPFVDRVHGRADDSLSRVRIDRAQDLLDLADLETSDRRKIAFLDDLVEQARARGPDAFFAGLAAEPSPSPALTALLDALPTRLHDAGILGAAELAKLILDPLEAHLRSKLGLDRRRSEDREHLDVELGVLKASLFGEGDLERLRLHLSVRAAVALREQLAAPASPLSAFELRALGALRDRITFARPPLPLDAPGIHIVDLSRVDDPDIRSTVGAEVIDQIFARCRAGRGSSPALLVVEEAQAFAPEFGSQKRNRALSSLLRVACEGRKFRLGLVLITQRPANVHKGVLAQTNTQAIFRLMNQADLDSVKSTIEGASSHLLRLLPSLDTGTGFLTGAAVRMPVLFRASAMFVGAHEPVKEAKA